MISYNTYFQPVYLISSHICHCRFHNALWVYPCKVWVCEAQQPRAIQKGVDKHKLVRRTLGLKLHVYGFDFWANICILIPCTAYLQLFQLLPLNPWSMFCTFLLKHSYSIWCCPHLWLSSTSMLLPRHSATLRAPKSQRPVLMDVCSVQVCWEKWNRMENMEETEWIGIN